MARYSLLAVALGLIVLSSLPAQEGRLGRVREEVKGTSPSQQPSRYESEGDGTSADQSSGDPEGETAFGTWFGEAFGESMGKGVIALAIAPFTLPRHMAGDRGQWLEFTRSPYLRGHEGFLIPPADASPSVAEKWSPRPWMARLSIENGNDFDGLNRFQGQLLFDTAARFGVVTNWDHYDERLSCGCGDHVTIGDVTLTYRFAQSERFLMRAGFGARTITDGHFTDWGVNLHYGGEWFPANPWIATGSVDFGNLGNAFVVRTRATLGVTWRGWEAFGGYDFLRIGDVNLHGPMVGVRWWF